MARLFSVFLAAAAMVMATGANAGPSKVAATYKSVYVPGGFDSNDQVQIVGEGMFRNACYRAAETTVRVDKSKKQIFVGPAAYEYKGFCLQVVLPFDRVIEVGILPAGNYEIFQAADNAKLADLNVSPALSDSADDYIYAPISQAFFRNKGAKSEILLSGDFPNSCMKLKEAKVAVEPKVIVVQPIAEMESRSDCQDGKFPFTKVVGIEFIKSGRYLMHIRAMNGKAINTLVDVQ